MRRTASVAVWPALWALASAQNATETAPLLIQSRSTSANYQTMTSVVVSSMAPAPTWLPEA